MVAYLRDCMATFSSFKPFGRGAGAASVSAMIVPLVVNRHARRGKPAWLGVRHRSHGLCPARF